MKSQYKSPKFEVKKYSQFENVFTYKTKNVRKKSSSSGKNFGCNDIPNLPIGSGF